MSNGVDPRVARVHLIGVATLILSLGLIPWRSADAASGAWPIIPAAVCSICYSSCAMAIGWIRRSGWGGWSIQSCVAMANFFNPAAFWRARGVLGWSPTLTLAILATVVVLSAMAQVMLRR